MSEDYGNDFITLVDEDGIEAEYEHIDTLEYNNEVYFALVKASDNNQQQIIDGDGELIILKLIIDENGDEILASIESEEEYDEIAQIFEQNLEEYYDIEH